MPFRSERQKDFNPNPNPVVGLSEAGEDELTGAAVGSFTHTHTTPIYTSISPQMTWNNFNNEGML